MNRLLRLVQVLDELADATLVLEDLVAPAVALVGERDEEPGVQERELAQPAREDVVLNSVVVKIVGSGLKVIFVPVLSVSPIVGQRRLRNAAPGTPGSARGLRA